MMGLKKGHEQQKQVNASDLILRALMESPREILKKGPTLPVRKQEIAPGDRKKGYQTQVVLKPPASTPLKPPTLPGYTPKSTSTRLAGGGMNLTENQIRYAKQEEDASTRRTKAGLASIGYSLAGTIPSLVETANQATHNFWKDQRNIPYQQALRDAGKVNAYAHGRLNTELGIVSDKQLEYEALRAKAYDLKTKTPVDPNRGGQQLMAKAREKREEATEGLTGVEKFIADQSISIGGNIPALLSNFAVPGLGLGVMGAQAWAQKTSELNARDIAPDVALGRGAAAGGIEVLTEKMPLDNLMDLVKGSGGKSFVKNSLKQMGIEATEESASYVANYIADLAANDPEALFSFKNLAMSALGGAFSGGVLGTAGQAVGTALNSRPAPRLPNMDAPQVAKESAGVEPPNMHRTAKAEAKEHANELLKKLKRSIPDMALDNPVKVLAGTEFPKSDVGIVKQVGDFFRSWGNKVTRQGFGDVIVDEAGVQSSIAHGLGRAKSVTFAAVPDVIKSGKQIDFQQNWKGRGYDSYVFAAPVTIAGKRAYVTAVVLKNEDNFYYLHEVLDGEGNIIYINNKEPGAIKTGLTVQDGITSDAGSLFDTTIPQAEHNVNSQSMQEEQDYTQKAAPYLSTPQQAQNVQRMRESGKQHGIPQETLDRISHIAKRFDVPVEFVDTLGDRVNGKYENGKITISKDTKNPMMAVCTHELTHHIESGGQYEQLAGMVQNYIGENFDSVTQGIKKLYAQEGIQLDDAGARKEAVSSFMENRGLFEDEAFVRRVTHEIPSLARQILDWITDTIKKIGANTDTKFLIDAQRLYEKAMREGKTAHDPGTSFFIQQADNGERITVVDQNQDMFRGKPVQTYSAIARKLLLDRFSGQVLPLGEADLVRLKRKQTGEYAYPSAPLDVKSVEYEAKMRASAELDNLLETAEYSHWARDTKGHPEATLGFDYYKVKFIVGGHLFEGLANVANSEKGRILYDITKIKEVPASSGTYATLLAQSTSTFGNLINDNVAPSTSTVNNQSMQDEGNDTQLSRSDVSDFMKQDLEQYREGRSTVDDGNTWGYTEGSRFGTEGAGDFNRLLKQSICSSDDFYKYLNKINSDYADTYVKTGKWPSDVQIPKSPGVLKADGTINWDEVPNGGYVLDGKGDAIKEQYVPGIGETIDRHGPNNGRFTSPISNNKPYSYAQRSLPYMENPSQYHQYKVTGDLSNIEQYFNQSTDANLKQMISAYMKKFRLSFSDLETYRGKIASGFGEIGDGEQYELPLPVNMLEGLGLLKEF